MRKENKREKTKFILDSSVAIAWISLICYILAILYIGTELRFYLWELFIIVVIFQAFLTISYTVIIKSKINLYIKNTTKREYSLLLLIIILNLLTANLLLLLYGLFAYKKLIDNSKSRNILF